MAIVRFSLQMGDRLPAASAVIFKRGAVVNGNQNAVNMVTVHQPHDFADGDKFYYALTRSNIIKTRVFTVTGYNPNFPTQVPYSGAVFTWPDGSFLVPLGTDTGAEQQPDGSYSDPNYDGSPLSVYSDPHGDDAYLYAKVPIEPGGDLGFWCSTSDLWILALDSRLRIVRFYIVSQSSATAGGSGGVTVDTDSATPGDDANPSFLIVRNAGEGDKLYIWAKGSNDAYAWEEIVQIA
jgi:hypothetical protein